MEFKYFWDKRRKLHPGEPKYISLCQILQFSGEEKADVTKIFLTYMKIGKDYDEKEAKEMIKYLVELAKDPND